MMPTLSPTGVVVVDAVCGALSAAFISIHTYGRLQFLGKLFLSDYILIASWLLWLPLQIANDYLCGARGFDDPHMTYTIGGGLPDFVALIGGDLPPLEMALKISFVQILLYHLAMLCMKMVFLLTYRRLFPPFMTRLRMALNITIGIVLVLYVVIVGFVIFWCFPVSRNWDLGRPLAERCSSVVNGFVFLLATAIHIFTDILIYVLPFFLVCSSSFSPVTDKRNIIAVRIMFSLGFICVLITVIRIVSTGTRASVGVLAAYQSAEIAAPQMVASLPMMKKLWKTFFAPGGTQGTDSSPSGAASDKRMSWRRSVVNEAPYGMNRDNLNYVDKQVPEEAKGDSENEIARPEKGVNRLDRPNSAEVPQGV